MSLALILLLFASAPAFAAERLPSARLLSDLPSGLLSPDHFAGELDFQPAGLFIERTPLDSGMGSVCRTFAADCQFVGDFTAVVLTYSCSSSPERCWRGLLAAVQASGVRVITRPDFGGATFTFHLEAAPVSASNRFGSDQ